MSKIEWTDESWNPITGCSKISEGCQKCYAERFAKRLKGRYGYPKDDPFKPGVCHPNQLSKPILWKKPRRIFVCSMGDLFHNKVEIANRCRVLTIAEHHAPQHTYLFLTKRPEIMAEVMKFYFNNRPIPKNWWLGVTAENQKRADERIPILLQIPAAIRFVSIEPMLGPVDIEFFKCPSCGKIFNWNLSKKTTRLQCDCGTSDNYYEIDKIMPEWVICGGEKGPGARHMHRKWAYDLRDQCDGANIPFFFKNWGSFYGFWKPNDRFIGGRIWDEYPKEN